MGVGRGMRTQRFNRAVVGVMAAVFLAGGMGGGGVVAGATTVPTEAGCTAAADYSAGLSGRGLLVMQGGKVVFQRYDNGFDGKRAHPLASGTKSFTGVLAAAAVEDGIIPSFDAKVSDTIGAWAGVPGKQDITVRQLLSLSSGLDPSDALLGSRGGGRVLGEGANALQRRQGGDDRPPQPNDLFAAALEVPMKGKPGAQFEYGSGHFYAFGAYLEERLRITGAKEKTFREYFDARIANPIGMNVAWWGKDKAGNPNTPGGMMLTATEWAKFGEFIRLRGAVKAEDGSLKQIVRADLIEELMKPSTANKSYGMTWWLPGAAGDADVADGNPRMRMLNKQMEPILAPDGKPVKVWMAAGLGKQRLLILPDYDVVIVRFAEATREGMAYNDKELITRVMGW